LSPHGSEVGREPYNPLGWTDPRTEDGAKRHIGRVGRTCLIERLVGIRLCHEALLPEHRYGEDDWNDRCRLLCREDCTSHRDNDIDLEPDELGRDFGEALAAPPAQRYSITTVRPSIQPSSRSRCTKAAVHGLQAEGTAVPRYPTVGSFGCCARAASGHAAAAPPRSVMNSRLFTRSPRRKARAAWAGFRGRVPWRPRH